MNTHNMYLEVKGPHACLMGIWFIVYLLYLLDAAIRFNNILTSFNQMSKLKANT